MRRASSDALSGVHGEAPPVGVGDQVVDVGDGVGARGEPLLERFGAHRGHLCNAEVREARVVGLLAGVVVLLRGVPPGDDVEGVVEVYDHAGAGAVVAEGREETPLFVGDGAVHDDEVELAEVLDEPLLGAQFGGDLVKGLEPVLVDTGLVVGDGVAEAREDARGKGAAVVLASRGLPV